MKILNNTALPVNLTFVAAQGDQPDTVRLYPENVLECHSCEDTRGLLVIEDSPKSKTTTKVDSSSSK